MENIQDSGQILYTNTQATLNTGCILLIMRDIRIALLFLVCSESLAYFKFLPDKKSSGSAIVNT
jgi:hypothetical protein